MLLGGQLLLGQAPYTCFVLQRVQLGSLRWLLLLCLSDEILKICVCPVLAR